ncbi:MFS transporter [Achromobacter aloeverae]|uniref:MFS transporter n=1 Tax=Achromobacter aloeverae TaxID=1750518 RepID=A0A4Q1HLG6_9BURK|nr:MFS transporter [Achromobacter aloeverae]RXN91287.1 MFS transporter [Achromobacter aloeverae]
MKSSENVLPGASAHAGARAVRRATWATMAQFFVNGATFATWGVWIPVLKTDFQVSDAVLSLAMLAVSAGAILAMNGVGRWVGRAGSARVLAISGLAYSIMLVVIPWAGYFPLLLVILVLFGMGMAAFDVAMNVQAATVEARLGKPVMSTLHGMFSLGGMAGAGLGGLLMGAGVSLQVHGFAIAAMTVLAALLATSYLLTDAPSHVEEGAAATPGIPRALWILGTVAFLGLVCEGAMYDWAAVYMRDVAGATTARSGYGYATFATGMAVGRFGADLLRRRFSDERLMTVSAWVGCAGMTLVIAAPWPVSSLVGFTLMGLGVANLMPFFFLAGARLPGMSPAAGVAGVARFAYVGMLLGPPLIGGITHAMSLRVALALVALTMGWIALAGIRRVCRLG